jgi:ABC-type transport system involved in multi-copper enzyme maturation permease subunit
VRTESAVRSRRHIGVLVRHDLRHTLSSARGLLYLVFFALFWGWVFAKLAGGLANQLGTPQAGFLVSWIFDSNVARLFQERPPTLAAYLVLAATLTPLFSMLASCDQTATDLGTRHIRFLIPRVGRAEIFVARLLGASIVVSVAQLLAGIAATIVAIVVHGGGDVATGAIVAYGAQVTGFLILYSLPIVALMSLVSAAMASVGLALLVGLGGYAVLALALSWAPLKGAAATIVSFVVPSGLKPYLLQPELGPALGACAGTFAYVALYVFLGWQVFRTRDA